MTRQPPPRTKKDQVADYLTELIDSGRLGPGDQLPSEHELRQRFGISRPTVREGLDLLIKRRLVVVEPRVGYFVRVAPDDADVELLMAEGHAATPCDSWLRSVQRSGYEGTQQVRVETLDPAAAATTKVAGRTLADRLDVSDGGLVVARHSLRLIARPGDDTPRPQELTVVYLPYDLVKDSEVMSPRDLGVPVDDVLTALGHPPVGFTDHLMPRIPTEQQAAALWLPSGTPVIETVRTCHYGPGHRRLSVRHTITGPDSALVYDMTHRAGLEQDAT